MRQKSTYVYVVCFGERGEGHDPVTAWSSLQEALDAAEKEFGVRPSHWGGVQWRGMTSNGCDEVYVQRLAVKGAAS